MYISNFLSKQTIDNELWESQTVTLSLESILKNHIHTLINKTVTAIQRGRLHRPLDKTYRANSRSSMSTSTTNTKYPYIEETVSSSECEDWSKESERSEDQYGTVSSSDSEIKMLLEKETKRTLEKNKEFLNPSRESKENKIERKYMYYPKLITQKYYFNKTISLNDKVIKEEDKKRCNVKEEEERGKIKKKSKGKKGGKGKSPSGINNKSIKNQGGYEGRKEFSKAKSKRQFEEDRYLPRAIRTEA